LDAKDFPKLGYVAYKDKHYEIEKDESVQETDEDDTTTLSKSVSKEPIWPKKVSHIKEKEIQSRAINPDE